jgi:uncharacterized protein (TIGR02118 family)
LWLVIYFCGYVRLNSRFVVERGNEKIRKHRGRVIMTTVGTDALVRAERRELLKYLCVGLAAGASVTGIAPEMATAAEGSGGAKVVFVLFRRADLTHEQSMAEWSGNQHTSIVRKIPGLKRWIQNHPMGARNEGSPDGIGELWFESAEAMGQAMKSPEMSAAGEDAKRFLDMTRTYAIVVEEKTIVA